ncbi:MAG TPA: hypothetical protein VFN30_11720 [Chitinophagaceae bacterium]|nr:hypothetical protein [Chitinophagaceae bacterium]
MNLSKTVFMVILLPVIITHGNALRSSLLVNNNHNGKTVKGNDSIIQSLEVLDASFSCSFFCPNLN